MQAFVPDYDCDLFISSARADVSPTTNDGENVAGWAQDLSYSLQSLIAQKLGRRDWGIVRGPSIGDGLLTSKSVRRCAALLIVLTREYLRDETCRTELEAFLSSLGDADTAKRVFVVLADDIGRESWPVALQSHLASDFLTSADFRNGALPAARRRLQVSDKPYPVRLDDLSTALANCLERLKRDAEQPSATDTTVFLGTASPDVVDLHDSMRRYLVQEGFLIEPCRWHSQESPGFREAMLQAMRSSQLFVQLLGVSSFPSVDGSFVGLGSMEVELAEEAGLPILSWRDPRLDVNSIVDVEHRRLLEGKYVLAVGLEEFKRKVVERAHAQATKPAVSFDKPLVVVAASDVDRTLARRVGELLGDRGLGIEIPDTEEFPWELYSNGKHGVGGLVIVYGACPAIWVRQQLWKYRKAMARTESRPPLCAVCEGPPQAKEPIRYDVPQMDMIDCRVQITEAALSSFIEAVQRRCSQ